MTLLQLSTFSSIFTVLLLLTLTTLHANYHKISVAASASASASCLPHERDALLEFKKRIGEAAGDLDGYSYWFSSWVDPRDANNISSTGVAGTAIYDCCRWKGVTCDYVQGFVTAINITNCEFHVEEDPISGIATGQIAHDGLSGELKAEGVRALASLTRLSILDLSCQFLNGSVPEEIGSLTSLTHLDLSYNFFSSVIPATLGNLTLLQHLDLSSSRFFLSDLRMLPANGWRPSFQLQTLDLSNCGFDGAFPSWLRQQTNLSKLSLARNSFSGKIPVWAWQLATQSLDLSGNDLEYTFSCDASILPPPPSLVKLDLSGNTNIRGTFPCFIANLTSLEMLAFSYTSMTGFVPDLFADLNLTYIDLSKSLFEGLLPPSLGRLKTLQYLDLSSNRFSSQEIPSSLLGSPSLMYLDLSFNNFTGAIPDAFPSLNSLEELHLSGNRLDGLLPQSMQHLTYLSFLNLSSNNFRGAIPEAFLIINTLVELDVSNNQLDGLLPPSMQYLTNLRHLDLHNNQFSPQDIPSYLFLFPFLSYLDLSFNNFTGISNFTGSADDFSSDYGNLDEGSLSNLAYFKLSSNKLRNLFDGADFPTLKYLVALDVSDNLLTGPFSPSLAKVMPNLRILNMNRNRLQGSIPSFIKFLKMILILDLSSNALSSNIPVWVGLNHSQLQILILAGNQLTGAIPASLGSLRAMQTDNTSFDTPDGWTRHMLRVFTDIDYHFDIPMTVKGQRRTFGYQDQLSLIDLSDNQLSGPIPPELGRLKCLLSLNLSSNRLEGEIPSTLGNLTNLEALDLSRNNLQGQIPSSFENLHELGFVNLSNNHLNGSIPSSSQWGTFNTSSFLNNDGLCIANPSVIAQLPRCVGIRNGTNVTKDSTLPTVDAYAAFWSDTVEWGGVALGYPLGLVLGLGVVTLLI